MVTIEILDNDHWNIVGTGCVIHKKIILAAGQSLYEDGNVENAKLRTNDGKRISTAQDVHLSFTDVHLSHVAKKVQENIVLIVLLEELNISPLDFYTDSTVSHINLQLYTFNFLKGISSNNVRKVSSYDIKVDLPKKTDIQKPKVQLSTANKNDRFVTWRDNGAPIVEKKTNRVFGIVGKVSKGNVLQVINLKYSEFSQFINTQIELVNCEEDIEMEQTTESKPVEPETVTPETNVESVNPNNIKKDVPIIEHPMESAVGKKKDEAVTADSDKEKYVEKANIQVEEDDQVLEQDGTTIVDNKEKNAKHVAGKSDTPIIVNEIVDTTKDDVAKGSFNEQQKLPNTEVPINKKDVAGVKIKNDEDERNIKKRDKYLASKSASDKDITTDKDYKDKKVEDLISIPKSEIPSEAPGINTVSQPTTNVGQTITGGKVIEADKKMDSAIKVGESKVNKADIAKVNTAKAGTVRPAKKAYYPYYFDSFSNINII